MVSFSQLIAGTMKFIDAEMLPALPASQRWIAGALLYAVQGKAPDLLAQYASHPLVAALGLIGGDGTVDIETARMAAKSACQKHGAAEVSIPMIGQFKLTEKNFDSLFRFIRSEAGSETD